MQALHDLAVPHLEHADELAARYLITLPHVGKHGLKGREHPAAVANRQHQSVDNESGKVHLAVGGGIDPRMQPGLDVDAPVAGAVGRGGGEVGAGDDARRVHGPQPARGGGGGSGGGHEQQGEQQVHANSVRRDRSAITGGRNSRGEPRKRHPVQECYDSGCTSHVEVTTRAHRS